MRSNKKYTNQTFTKRVDHEGGAHRPFAAIAEPAVCKTCGAIFADRRWTAPAQAAASAGHPHWRPAAEVVCPACKQIESHVVGGYLTISGKFVADHHDEIDNLMVNEADRAAEDNPLCRIMGRSETDGRLEIETTTEHLAQRLGHALEKAYDGEVTYDFSHENKLARVTWHRD
jgi:hypothetical protein